MNICHNTPYSIQPVFLVIWGMVFIVVLPTLPQRKSTVTSPGPGSAALDGFRRDDFEPVTDHRFGQSSVAKHLEHGIQPRNRISNLSIYWSIYLSIYLSVYVDIYIYIYIYMYVYIYIYASSLFKITSNHEMHHLPIAPTQRLDYQRVVSGSQFQSHPT